MRFETDKVFKDLPDSKDRMILVFDGVCRILKLGSALTPLKEEAFPKVE